MTSARSLPLLKGRQSGQKRPGARTAALTLGLWMMAGAVPAQVVTTLTPEPFEASGGITVAPDGTIFVANFGTFLNLPNGAEVYRVSPLGEVELFAQGLSGASGNTIGTDGALYQSSIAGNHVSRIEADGSRSFVATAADGLSNPVGLTFDSAGNLFVANCGSNTITRLSPEGTAEMFSSSLLLNCPNGLTADDDDNLYAANFSDGRVIRITPTGTATLFASTPSGTTRPQGGNGHIAFANNQLYVVSNATHQVFSLDLSGQLTLLAGSGTRGRVDGPALEASFALPNGIGVSPDGQVLYVNDSEDLSADNNISPNVVRAIRLGGGQPINAGMTGAWFNPQTPGQGFLFDVDVEADLFFAAWFTFEAPGNKIGDPSHRWFTAQGPITGATAPVPIFSTTGGVFDDPQATDTVAVGQLEISFRDCVSADVQYTFADGRAGAFPLVRLTPDAFCAAVR